MKGIRVSVCVWAMCEARDGCLCMFGTMEGRGDGYGVAIYGYFTYLLNNLYMFLQP